MNVAIVGEEANFSVSFAEPNVLGQRVGTQTCENSFNNLNPFHFVGKTLWNPKGEPQRP